MAKIKVEWLIRREDEPRWASVKVKVRRSRNGNPFFKMFGPYEEEHVFVAPEGLRSGSEVITTENGRWVSVGRVLFGGRKVFLGEGPTRNEYSDVALKVKAIKCLEFGDGDCEDCLMNFTCKQVKEELQDGAIEETLTLWESYQEAVAYLEEST